MSTTASGHGSDQFNPLAVPAARTQDAPPAGPVTTTADSAAQPEAAAAAPAPVRDVHAVRRRRLGQIAIGLVVVGFWAWHSKPWTTLGIGQGTGATTAGVVSGQGATAAAAGTSAAAQDLVASDMVTAKAYLAAHGTLDGIALDGAQLAVRGTTMYAARTVGSACVVYGILDGRNLNSTVDASGAACAGQIVTVQAALDQAAAAATSSATSTAKATLATAAAGAVQYASRHFVAGQPSLAGLGATTNGAQVTSNTGANATLRVSYPNACVQTYVTAAGQIGPATTCP